MHEDRKRGSRRECTKPGGVKTGNVHGPEPRMRRHLRRWSTQDACKNAPPPLRLRPVRPVPPARDAIPGSRPDRPFRPVRPGLSLAPATWRSVACDRRAPVLMRIDAGTYTTATNTHPRQPQIHDGPEPRMRRHLRRWSKHDLCKRATPPLRLRPVRPVPPARDAIPGPRRDRPIRPVRPVLSLAPATWRSVACDRRAPVLMRIDAGTYTAVTNTHPRQPQIHHRPATQRPRAITHHKAGSC
jgi:hypothetical protein